MIRNDVPRNAQEPTAERRAITATGDAAKGAKEDVLSDFFGNVAIRQSPGREIVDTGHVASIELRERSGIPELGLGHQLGASGEFAAPGTFGGRDRTPPRTRSAPR